MNELMNEMQVRERITEIEKRIKETEQLIENGTRYMESLLAKLRDLNERIPKETRRLRSDREQLARYEIGIYKEYETERLMTDAMITLKEEYEEELKKLKASLSRVTETETQNSGRSEDYGYVVFQRANGEKVRKMFFDLTREELYEYNIQEQKKFMKMMK